ncbi:hypothetical protein ACHQM5_009188 [Ranunculus cassubicifolius]
MDSLNNKKVQIHHHQQQHHNKKDKIIVVLGATGTGKSRLSIDLAARYFPSEVINSDKIQVYKGLDITTNKIPHHERLSVPHHLLGEFDSEDGELTPSEYRKTASLVIEDILSRHRIPMIVGGSNSLIHALLSDRFVPELDVFNDPNSCISSELRYDCCFLWVDVGVKVLYQYIRRRVDDMFDSGMLEELIEYYESEPELTQSESIERVGIKKAIGLPEFEEYFLRGNGTMDAQLKKDLAEAIKINTWTLVERQLEKIQRLIEAGWDIRRLDATDAFRAVLVADSDKYSDMWQKKVLVPSVKIVKRFLEE